MYSRAHLIIERELDEIAGGEDSDTIVVLKTPNILELVALINGQKGTLWSEGVFQVNLKLDETYNERPPRECYFPYIPFHPNVHAETGRPSLDFLNDEEVDRGEKWSPARRGHSLKHVLKSLQHLLAYPLLDRAVNMEAVFVLKDNPSEYERIVKETVLATQDIRKLLIHNTNIRKLNNHDKSCLKLQESGISTTAQLPTSKLTKETMRKRSEDSINKIAAISSQMSSHTQKSSSSNDKNKSKNVSFDEYSRLWRDIATTKSRKEDTNGYVDSCLLTSANAHLLSQHVSISVHELEEHINRHLAEHRQLMYGRFGFTCSSHYSSTSRPSTMTAEATNYNKLKIQAKQKQAPPSKEREKKDDNDNDMFEKEVDELINWTKSI